MVDHHCIILGHRTIWSQIFIYHHKSFQKSKNKTQNFWTLWVVTWKEVASYNNKNNHLILFWGASRDSIFSLTANFHVKNVAWVHNIMLHMANSMCVLFFFFKGNNFLYEKRMSDNNSRIFVVNVSRQWNKGKKKYWSSSCFAQFVIFTLAK